MKEDLVLERPFGMAILAGVERSVVYARIVNLWFYNIFICMYSWQWNDNTLYTLVPLFLHDIDYYWYILDIDTDIFLQKYKKVNK